MPKLYVIIVTYNGMSWIDKCIVSVLNSSIDALPVVIDNNSNDGIVEYVKSKYTQCKIFETGKNLGFGKANNVGIQWAVEQGAEYVYLLNQDAWVENDTFEILIRIHQENKEYIILSPLQISANGLNVDKGFYENALGKNRCPNLYNDYLCGVVKDVYPTQFVMAAHWLLYIPHLKKVGLFSPIFPHYGEDTNFVHRSHWYGFLIGVCPHTKAYHDRQYREIPPSQMLYKEEISLLAILNNPSLQSRQRMKRYARFVSRVLKISQISIFKKFQTIFNAISLFPKSRKYRTIYQSDQCYQLFSYHIEDENNQ